MIKPPYHDIKISATISVPNSLITTLLQDAKTQASLRALLLGQKELTMTVQEAIDAVNAKLDASTDKATQEREEVRVAVEGMQTTITELIETVEELQEQLNNGVQVTPEQMQSVLDNAQELDVAIGEVFTPEPAP